MEPVSLFLMTRFKLKESNIFLICILTGFVKTIQPLCTGRHISYYFQISTITNKAALNTLTQVTPTSLAEWSHLT